MKKAKRLSIEPSAAVVMNDLAMKKKKAGEKVYNLSAGEPMIDTPKIIIDAANEAMKKGYTHYSPVAGIFELRKEACVWMKKNYSCEYSEEEVIVTCGGKFAVYEIIQTLVDPENEVIIIAPYWVSYKSMIELAGGKVNVIKTKESDNWKLGINQLKDAISKDTKILVLNNGSNPTGNLYTKEELKEILKLACENDVLVISDEVYSGLVYDGEYISCGSFAKYKDNVLIVQSCSKNFAMTGWRVGFVFGPKEIINSIKILQSQSITNTSTISQWAAITALQNSDTITKDLKKEMKKRRDVFVAEFNKFTTKKITSPQSALYAFIPIKLFGVSETDSVKFCKQLLEQSNIAAVPGIAFGQEGYIRCSYGVPVDEIKQALKILALHISHK